MCSVTCPTSSRSLPLFAVAPDTLLLPVARTRTLTRTLDAAAAWTGRRRRRERAQRLKRGGMIPRLSDGERDECVQTHTGGVVKTPLIHFTLRSNHPLHQFNKHPSWNGRLRFEALGQSCRSCPHVCPETRRPATGFITSLH